MNIPKLMRQVADQVVLDELDVLLVPPRLVRQVADPEAAALYNAMFPEPESLEFDYEEFQRFCQLHQAPQAQVGIYDYEGMFPEDLPPIQAPHPLVRQVADPIAAITVFYLNNP
jgi:hypothetical protein